MTTADEVNAYNELIEQAFLNTNRKLTQALIALQTVVNRLNDLCDPNEEWWQEVDVFFEDATIKDPRGKKHVFECVQTTVTKFEVFVPHALNITNHLNSENVVGALNNHVRSLIDWGQVSPEISETIVPVTGHTIHVTPMSDPPTADTHIRFGAPW